ncbi:hypothetical protein E2C01_100074 [Portunus trituberculatus]|uniref:Uncharacterized protein n=1 Tax=Portunus trituberculatus TaxID=210409 RepID=A0A5B7KH07_PORTR|nr:hypothetical protein [Portunus trituberculatus]
MSEHKCPKLHKVYRGERLLSLDGAEWPGTERAARQLPRGFCSPFCLFDRRIASGRDLAERAES